MTENKDVYNEVCVFLKKYIIEFVNSTFEEEKINIRSEYFYQTKSKKRKTVNKLLANKIQLYNQTYTEKTLSFIENTSELINYELIFHKKKLEADIVRHKLDEDVEGKILDSYFQTPSKKKKYIRDFFIFVAEKIKHLENINFLISERDNLNNDIKKEESISINETPILQPLKWQGTSTELIELTKALIENETFKGQGTQKEIFSKIQNLFDIELKNPSKTINSFDIVRNGGNETKFLDALKVSLLSNINIKRKNRENR
jgi:hypothetical protein